MLQIAALVTISATKSAGKSASMPAHKFALPRQDFGKFRRVATKNSNFIYLPNGTFPEVRADVSAYRIPFVCGAGLSFASLMAVRQIKLEKKEQPFTDVP